MIELRGLHLGNIARSPAESVRPDLWPDYAWVPALGCTGSRVFDLCGANDCAADVYPSSGIGWTEKGVAFLDLDRVFLSAADTPAINCTYIFSASFSSMTEDRGGFFVSGEGVDPLIQVWMDEYSPDRIGFSVFDGAAYRVEYSDGIDSGFMYTCAIRVDSTKTDFFPGTSLIPKSIPYIPNGSAGKIRIGSHNGKGGLGTVVGAYMCYSRCLQNSLVIDLTADPLLPFRRRQPVYYSVPSGNIETPAAMMML